MLTDANNQFRIKEVELWKQDTKSDATPAVRCRGVVMRNSNAIRLIQFVDWNKLLKNVDMSVMRLHREQPVISNYSNC